MCDCQEYRDAESAFQLNPGTSGHFLRKMEREQRATKNTQARTLNWMKNPICQPPKTYLTVLVWVWILRIILWSFHVTICQGITFKFSTISMLEPSLFDPTAGGKWVCPALDVSSRMRILKKETFERLLNHQLPSAQNRYHFFISAFLGT